MNIEHVVSEIKQKVDIVEYIGRYVTLKKAGKNYTSPCPFHSEKTPSFVVSPDRGIWKCFGACQDGGDVIAFLMKWDNITFSEAIRDLAQGAGIQIQDFAIEDREWKKKEKILQMNQLTAKYFHYILTEHASGKDGREYITKRELNDKIVETFQLGYAPQSWDSLTLFLKKRGFTEDMIVDAGLAIRNDNKRVYDRFRGRLMFPIMNARHDVLGFSGRLLTADSKQAKYINTPETAVYHKRETLYGLHAAHEAIKKEDGAIIVEGEFDMISSYMHGLPNTVAVKGSSVTKDQLMLLKRFTKHIILALDADFSGTSTALRAIRDAEAMDFRIDVIQFEEGKDPDEALRTNPVEYKKRLKKPVSLYDFIIDTSLKKHNAEDAYEKKEIATEVLPFIGGIANPIIKGHYFRRLSTLLDIEERDISSMLRSLDRDDLKKRVHSSADKKPSKQEDRYEILQKYVLSYMVQHEHPLTIFADIKKKLKSSDFTTTSYQEIFNHFSEYVTSQKDVKTSKFDMNTFTENFSDPLQAVLDDLFLLDISSHLESENPDKSFRKSILELKHYSLRAFLKKGVHNSEDTDINKISQELARVEKELRIM